MSTPSGSENGCRPTPRHARARRRDRRFVRHRRVRVGRRMARLGRILPKRAAHLIERLGARVPRLEFVVIERPARRRAVGILDRAEVLRAIADQHRAVELGVAADIIVVAGIERLARAVDPGLLRAEDAALEDRARVARLRRVEQDVRRARGSGFRRPTARARRRRSPRPCQSRRRRYRLCGFRSSDCRLTSLEADSPLALIRPFGPPLRSRLTPQAGEGVGAAAKPLSRLRERGWGEGALKSAASSRDRTAPPCRD